jgi:DNA end-binding protein Ku
VRAAFPKATQTIEIESFVKRSELLLMLLERPYYLRAEAKSEHIDALLRETLPTAGLVMTRNTRPTRGDALALEVLRWVKGEPRA